MSSEQLRDSLKPEIGQRFQAALLRLIVGAGFGEETVFP